MHESIRLIHLIRLAAGLRSEDGENPDYDRALVELCADAAGLTQNDYGRVRKMMDEVLAS